MKVFEMFSGFGGASFSLKKAGIYFESVGYSEIDKFAIQCFNQNHEGNNYGDCTKINPSELPDFDLLTGGFPCQSFSLAGKGQGEQDSRGTLFNDIIRIAEIKMNRVSINNILQPYKKVTFISNKVILNIDGNSLQSEISKQKVLYRNVFPNFTEKKEYSQTSNETQQETECFLQCIEKIWDGKYGMGDYGREFNKTSSNRKGNVLYKENEDNLSKGLQYNRRWETTNNNKRDKEKNINGKQREYTNRCDEISNITSQSNILFKSGEQESTFRTNENNKQSTRKEKKTCEKTKCSIEENVEKQSPRNEKMERTICKSETCQEHKEDNRNNRTNAERRRKDNKFRNSEEKWLFLEDSKGTLIIFGNKNKMKIKNGSRYMLLENVKGLTTKKHAATFQKILSELKRIGYYVHWKVLNSKEHGIPQNRERVFFICFRNYVEYSDFLFPEKEELNIFLKDILEKDVDEKYYLSEEVVKRLISTDRMKEVLRDKIGVCQTSTMWKGAGNSGCNLIQVNNPKHSNNRVYSDEGVSPTLSRIRKLTPKECFRLQGFLDDEINLDGLSSTQRYRLAGNGFDVNLVSKIFKQMFKQNTK